MSMLWRVVAVLVILVGAAAAADGAWLYKDPKQPVVVRVHDLLSRMTLAEKIGQMTQIEKTVANSSVIESYYIGSILSNPSFTGKPGNYSKAADWANMTDSFQRAALRTRLSIPLMYGVDAVHGHNGVLRATMFPHNVGLGCTRDPELVKRIGSATALEVRATGIPYVFAPCIAVCRDPRWGRCYESYSEDPDVVSNMTSIIEGLQGQAPANWQGPFVQNSRKVAACAKHFVGDGGTTKGMDRNDTVISFEGLVNIHMKPYFDAIAKGVSTIMVSYSSWNGVKMHANNFLLTDILKGYLGFQGFLISDFQGVDRITDEMGTNYSNSVRLSINAGMDMVMVPFDYQNFSSIVKDHVEHEKILMTRIDDAVSRILRVKFQMGLFEEPYSSPKLHSYLGAESHKALAREAVRKSLVLLKNEERGSKKGKLLPLNSNAKNILVVGAHANDMGLQCGGWTISWQGSPGNTTRGTTIMEGIYEVASAETSIDYKASPKEGFAKGKKYDYAIVVVGEQPYVEIDGDNLNLTLPDPYPALIHDTCSYVPCVVVLISGRPLVMEKYMPMMDALVAAWLPGTEGGGIADVLFGKFEFQGKLSRTWFKTVDQLPMNVGDKEYDPLFPFGFGLKMGL